jgi:meso-butanediol dehydrogenase / (S,S)-butanediol dehydrogenase / diacetyl reductase
MDTTRHAGKAVIVTGGANGIGAATVDRFLAEGASVVAADISAERLEALAARTDPALPLSTQVVDVADQASFESLVAVTVERLGRLDVLVNNAGTAIVGTIEQIDAADWHRILDIDLSSIFYGVRAALPHLRKTRGNVVNTASISGLGANKSLSAYYAAKGGVVNFTRYLAVEHGHEGIRVNAVAPGPVNSNPGLMDVGQLFEDYLANIPAKRLGTSEDIASAIAFLASDDASYISGHNLVVDGALTAWTGEPDLGPYLPLSNPSYR